MPYLTMSSCTETHCHLFVYNNFHVFMYVVFTIMGFGVIVSNKPCSQPMSLGPWHVQQLHRKKKKTLNLEFFPVCFFTKRHSQIDACVSDVRRKRPRYRMATDLVLQSSRNALKFETNLVHFWVGGPLSGIIFARHFMPWTNSCRVQGSCHFWIFFLNI